MPIRRKRGWSRAFTPGRIPTTPPSAAFERRGRRYMLDAIPAGFWSAVRAKAKREGLSLRNLILGLLQQWLAGEIALARPTQERASS